MQTSSIATSSSHTPANRFTADDAGKLVLRVSLALLLLLHGIAKLSGGIDFISGYLDKAGLPGIVGYGVYIGEVVAPLLILIGFKTRIAALIAAVNMIVAVILVHLPQMFTLTKTGGWALELQAFYLVAAIAVAIMGAGKCSVDEISKR